MKGFFLENDFYCTKCDETRRVSSLQFNTATYNVDTTEHTNLVNNL